MNMGDPVYMTTDGRIHIPKKPGLLQRLKLFIGRKFGIKRWQPRRPFIGLARDNGGIDEWVGVYLQPLGTHESNPFPKPKN